MITALVTASNGCHWLQLAKHNRELAEMLKVGQGEGGGDCALDYYSAHTAQIEVSTGQRVVILSPCSLSTASHVLSLKER